MKIFKEFTFDSAHFLPNVPDGHKCKEIHGHTYRMIVYIEGDLEPDLEWVMDFSRLKKIVEPVIKSVDHKFLNKISGLENPTCEKLAIWLWNQIKPEIPMLKTIELHETPTSGVIYEGK
ncbi:MAG: 6-carboxytetrahydropterin synthase QueD [Chitinophagaceae bacterium]